MDHSRVYGEKGMISAVYRSENSRLLDIYGGSAKNIVCPRCTVKTMRNCYSSKKLADFFNNNSIEYSVEELEDGDVITVYGKAAHASTPELGINAISWLLVGLKEAGIQDPFVDFYCSRFGLATDGSGLNIKLADEFGELTLSNGIISMSQDGIIQGTTDIRFPVTMTAKAVLKAMALKMEDAGGSVEIVNTVEPLFFPMDSQLVSSLFDAYSEVTGDTIHRPETIGGGTYAKSIHNTIAFGCAFPGKDYHIHDANEWVGIDELLLQAEIYVHALIKLLEIE